jgi:hypothetical protein
VNHPNPPSLTSHFVPAPQTLAYNAGLFGRAQALRREGKAPKTLGIADDLPDRFAYQQLQQLAGMARKVRKRSSQRGSSACPPGQRQGRMRADAGRMRSAVEAEEGCYGAGATGGPDTGQMQGFIQGVIPLIEWGRFYKLRGPSTCLPPHVPTGPGRDPAQQARV